MHNTKAVFVTSSDAASGPLSVVHVSGDFPDPIEPFKTPVINRLVDLTSDVFQHRVISINRRSPNLASTLKMSLPWSFTDQVLISSQAFEYGSSLVYDAPPRGILHRKALERLGNYLAEEIRQLPQRPDLLVAHKLTIEGIAVSRASSMLEIPYCVTIQGNSDRKILRIRPDLRKLFQSIYQNAQTVFAFTPNARSAIEGLLGRRQDRVRLMPCPMDHDQIIPPKAGGKNIVSIFHLKNHQTKNLAGIASAAKILAERGTSHSVSVIGGGAEQDLAACMRITSKCSSISFPGPLEPSAVRQRMNNAIGLVMPSRSESFGLVFVEALFSGLPIIYPADTAIDGYFDDLPFALRVDGRSPDAIANAMQLLVDQEVSMKAALSEWQNSVDSNKFKRPNIAQVFREGLVRRRLHSDT